MSERLSNATAALLERLLRLARQDEELRTVLRDLAQTVLSATESGADVAQPAAVEQLARDAHAAVSALEHAVAEAGLPTEPPATPQEPLPELTLGKPRFSGPIAPTSYVRARTPDSDEAEFFRLVEQRCRLKAEGARWAVQRRQLIAQGANFKQEVDPRDRDIIARAKKLPECFLWMNHSTAPAPADLSLYETVAGCFDALAAGAALMGLLRSESQADATAFEAGLDLLAEAQSALRVAAAQLDGQEDADQRAVFYWLRKIANEEQIPIRRYMRLDDPADPNQWQDLLSRMEALKARASETQQRGRQRKKLLGKVKHKVSLILQEAATAADEWRILIQTVDELVGDGLPPSNRELREMLLPVVDQVPEIAELPRNFELVLREIDHYLAICPPSEAPAPAPPSEEVQQAAALLRGKSLLLIGGEKRPAALQAIREAFGLRELVWLETRAHESIGQFAPYVARPDIAAVLLAIRWSSHVYGEVKQFCDAHGKPLVRLPGGYNPNQVAKQIMTQCSQRLQEASSAT